MQRLRALTGLFGCFISPQNTLTLLHKRQIIPVSFGLSVYKSPSQRVKMLQITPTLLHKLVHIEPIDPMLMGP